MRKKEKENKIKWEQEEMGNGNKDWYDWKKKINKIHEIYMTNWLNEIFEIVTLIKCPTIIGRWGFISWIEVFSSEPLKMVW